MFFPLFTKGAKQDRPSISSLIQENPLAIPIRSLGTGVTVSGGVNSPYVQNFGSHMLWNLGFGWASVGQNNVNYRCPNGCVPPHLTAFQGSITGSGFLDPILGFFETNGSVPVVKMAATATRTGVGAANFATQGSTNCGGVLEIKTTVSNGTETAALVLPKVINRDSLKVAIFTHGSGSDRFYVLTQNAENDHATDMRGLINGLLNDGYVILAINGGSIIDNWGNPSSFEAVQNCLNWIDTNIGKRTKTVMNAISMGGLTGLRAAAYIPSLSHVYCIDAVINLNAWVSTSSYASATFTAWAVANAAGLAAVSQLYDPMTLPQANWTGKKIKLMSSANDTAVSKTNNTDAFVTRATGFATISTITHTGNHIGNDSVNSSDILAFYNS